MKIQHTQILALGCLALAATFLTAAAHAQITYLESGGQVVVEGELFTSRDDVVPQGDSWLVVPVENAGAGTLNNERGFYVQSLPDQAGGGGGPNVPPSIQYEIAINTPGTYELFLRWANNTNVGGGGNSDSIFVDIVEIKDGGGGQADWYELTKNSNTFTWDGGGQAEVNQAGAANNAITWNLAAGTYNFRVSQREDGSAVDAFILQEQSQANPASGAVGPAASFAEMTVAGTTSATVDPFTGDDTATLDFGTLRVGTSSSMDLSVSNSGSGTEFDATVALQAGDADFSGPNGTPTLTSGNAPNIFSYSYAPDERGGGSQSRTVNVTSGLNIVQTNDVDVTLAGNAVGPVFGADLNGGSDPNLLAAPGGDTSGSLTPTSTLAGTLDFGETGSSVTLPLTIGNMTTDGDQGSLTDLTITGYSITGTDAAYFMLDSDPTGTLLSGGLNASSILDLMVTFTNDASNLGPNSATLNLFTDQGAALGGTGAAFQIDLQAVAVPEPASIALWLAMGMVFAGVSLRFRRK